MSFWGFFRGKWPFLAMAALTALFCAALLLGLNVGWYVAAFISGMFLLGTAAALVLEYLQKRRFYQDLKNNLEGMEKKYLLPETLDEPDFLEGRLAWQALRQAGKSMADEAAACRRALSEYQEYVEAWVHEIKTPIASALLLTENHPGEASRAAALELERIDGLVEQAMFYARSRMVEKDYVLKRVSLKELTASALRKNARLLVESRASVEQSGLEPEVPADGKWVDFILTQLLVNSVKYAGERPLALRFQGREEADSVVLTVSDNGPGIPPEDLPRVCEKGFTGQNGRRGRRSSGMGLYLCRSLCGSMGLGFSVQSRLGEGVQVSIRFPRNSMQEVYDKNVREA